ncbi:MAG: hypothetical protein HKN10_02290 [Myxococcales bacterium]|nr:hypothetical protein [Myxococcales bacterium]
MRTSQPTIGDAPAKKKGRIMAFMLKIQWNIKSGREAESKEALAGFGATYERTGKNAFALNPHADKHSIV